MAYVAPLLLYLVSWVGDRVCILWCGRECTGQMVSEMIWMVKLVMVFLVIVRKNSKSNGIECYPAGLLVFIVDNVDLSAI